MEILAVVGLLGLDYKHLVLFVANWTNWLGAGKTVPVIYKFEIPHMCNTCEHDCSNYIYAHVNVLKYATVYAHVNCSNLIKVAH